MEGNTQVNVGTEETVSFISIDDDPATEDVDESTLAVEGADIIDVFGGGLGTTATVSGNTNVVIGRNKDDDTDTTPEPQP